MDAPLEDYQRPACMMAVHLTIMVNSIYLPNVLEMEPNMNTLFRINRCFKEIQIQIQTEGTFYARKGHKASD